MMKKTAITCLFLALLSLAIAQNRQTRYINQPSNKTGKAHPDFTENLVLNLSGNFQGIAPIELQLMGTGPEFLVDVPLTQTKKDVPANILTLQVSLKKLENHQFHTSYSIGVRTAITPSVVRADDQVTKNFQYRDIVQKGAIILTPGKPLPISQLHEHVLKLSIKQAE